MLRTLIQKKEALREKMTALWQIRDDGKSWTPEQKSEYDKHSEAVKKLNSDIKERSEFLENFNQSLPKADKAFMDLQKNKASIVKIIKSAVYQANPNDSRFKVDDGPIREVAEERSKNFDSNAIIAGGVPIPASHFRDRFTDQKLQKRTTITTGAGLGADLVEDTIMPEIIPNLYSKAWAGRAGCEFVEGARGNYLIPAEDTKPSSGFVAEGSAYPESDIDYKNQVSLSPLRCGAIQKFTYQTLLQDETRQLQNSINSQLMKQWAQKVDGDFMNADGTANKPKGILNITGIQEIEGSGADGDDLTFASLIDASGLLRANDQDMKPTWITNSKVITKAMKTLRNNVAGSLYIGDNKQIANMKYVETNIVKSDLTKGSSGATLSQAVLIIPSSIVIVQWNMPFISIDRSNGFANDEIWTKISGYVNIGLKRPKDVVNYKSIKTA